MIAAVRIESVETTGAGTGVELDRDPVAHQTVIARD